MAAGTKYNITPEYKPEEIYRVETGVRKSGPWKLDVSNLPEGATLPVFTPVYADFESRTVSPVRNFRVKAVVEDIDSDGNPILTEDGEATVSVCVGDNPLAYAGLRLSNDNGEDTEVLAVTKDASGYWIKTVGEVVAGSILSALGHPANFVLYDAKKVELDAPVLCTLLMQAYEVKESKLCIPMTDADKEALTSRFQFE